MSSFPPSRWEVRYLKDMMSLSCTAREDGEISMAAYMAVKPCAGEEGSFRFALAGPDKVKLRFVIQEVLPGPQFTGMVAEAELGVGDQIQLEKNSVCGVWLDLVELVRSQDILIVNSEDDDTTDVFLNAMDNYKKELLSKTGKADMAGISFRWILGTFKDDTNLTLIAQVLIVSMMVGTICTMLKLITIV